MNPRGARMDSGAGRERVSPLGGGRGRAGGLSPAGEGGGGLQSVAQCFPLDPSRRTATFAPTCVHRCVCLLNGRRSDELIVGRSVRFPSSVSAVGTAVEASWSKSRRFWAGS